jgi:hypothetical protein
MKKAIITIFLISILSAVVQHFFAWWSVCIVCFAFGLIAKFSPQKSFVTGGTAIGLLWLLEILMKDIPNHHTLSTRMAQLFPLGGHYLLFMLISVLIGAFCGGLSMWSAACWRKVSQ